MCYIFCVNCQCCVLHHTVVPPGVVLGGDLTKGDGTGGECSPGGMYKVMHIYSSSTLYDDMTHDAVEAHILVRN